MLSAPPKVLRALHVLFGIVEEQDLVASCPNATLERSECLLVGLGRVEALVELEDRLGVGADGDGVGAEVSVEQFEALEGEMNSKNRFYF